MSATAPTTRSVWVVVVNAGSAQSRTDGSFTFAAIVSAMRRNMSA